MKHSVFMMTAALVMAAGCSKVSAVPEVNEEVHEFTITASCGADSKVASAFGDDQNTINFTWSENDSIFVVFVPKESLETMTEAEATALHSYVFKLKSGAGTNEAVFSCSNLTPAPMQPGVTYKMYAAYNPYIEEGDTMPIWHEFGNGIVHDVFVNQKIDPNQLFDPLNPVSNFGKQEVLTCYGVEITAESSSPSISFIQRLSAYKLKVRNTGSEPLTIISFKYPTCKRILIAYPGYGSTYPHGLDTGEITCKTPITINAGESYPFYIVMQDQHNPGGLKYDYIFYLDNGSSITVSKCPSMGVPFAHGYLVSTTIAISASMASSGTIPPISGDDEDDF